jgi:hypothetical protein
MHACMHAYSLDFHEFESYYYYDDDYYYYYSRICYKDDVG